MRIRDSLSTLVCPSGSWSISLSPLFSSQPPMTTGDAFLTHPTFPPHPSPRAVSAKDFRLLRRLSPPTSIWQVPPARNSTFSKATRTRSTPHPRLAPTTSPAPSAVPALPTTSAPQYTTRPPLARRRPHPRSRTTSSRQTPRDTQSQ